MAKKATLDSMVLEIKKASEENKVKIGFKEAIRAIQSGSAQKVFAASNMDSEQLEELKTKCERVKVPLAELKISNVDLGTAIKKPFSVATITMVKE